MPITSEDTLPAASARGAEPVRGDAIDRYVVLDVVGRGGMGVVVSAYDPELDRRVAVKLFAARRDGGDHSEGQLRLVREAQAMARLSHPNVVPVYDAGTYAGGVFVAMELIDGTTLGAWCKDPARTWREIVAAYLLAGRGLAAAHAAGLIHRDFKPDNVLVARSGAVKVTDFGLVTIGDDEVPRSAAEVPTQDPTDLTRTGAIMGTPRYMAPEQFADGELDARTDQFSFCASLYEALWRHPPFAGATFAAIAASVLDGDLRDPEPASPIPGPMREAILRGLALRPRDRHPSMETLLAALAARPRSRRRLAWIAAAAIVIAGGGVALAARPDAADTCPLPDTSLDGAWSAATRAAIARGFAATGRSYAHRSADDAVAGLDAYLTRWAGARRDACRAARTVRATPGAADRRLACLDRRRENAIALIEVLAAPDATTVAMASQAVARLPPIAECADGELLQRPTPAPAAAARVAQLQRELASARALADAGHYADALVRTAALASAAAAAGFAPLEAEVLVLRGELESSTGDARHARATLHDAAALARRDGLPDVETAAWMSLTTSERMGEDHQSSLDAARMAGAIASRRDDRRGAIEASLREAWALAQLGDPVAGARVVDGLGPDLAIQTQLDWRLAGRLASTRSVIAHAQGDAAAAYRIVLEARASYAAHLGADHPELAYLDSMLANEAYAIGHTDEARRLIDEARALVRAAGIRDAGAVEISVNNAILTSDLGGDAGPALDEAEALAAALSPDAMIRLWLRNVRGLVAFRAGRLDEALGHYRFVVDRIGGRNAALDALANENLAKTLTLLERAPEAEAPARRALELRLAMEPDPRRAALTRGMLARILSVQDRDAEAIPIFEAALRDLAPPPPGRAGEVAELTVAYAIALQVVDRDAEAEPAVAPVIETLRATHNDYYLGLALGIIADDRWAHGDRAGAVAAARDGRAALAREATSPEELAELDRWLRSHRAR